MSEEGKEKAMREQLREKMGLEDVEFLTPESEIQIDPEACVRECGGRCCWKTESIVLLPPDVLNIRQATGMSSTTVLQQRMDRYIGKDSKAPLVCMLFGDEEGKSTPCPFLAPALDVPPFEEEVETPEKLAAFVAEHQISTGDERRNLWLCACKTRKPFICRLFPFGIVEAFTEGKPEEASRKFFLTEKNCPMVGQGEKMPLSQWLKRMGVTEEELALRAGYMKLFARFRQFEESPEFNVVRQWIATMLYDWDLFVGSVPSQARIAQKADPKFLLETAEKMLEMFEAQTLARLT